MAELLKNLYNKEFLQNFSALIRGAWTKFSSEAFISAVMDSEWQNLTLKERMRKISIELGRHLPSDYGKAIAILFKIDSQCNGFTYLILPDFVAVHGLAEKDFELVAPVVINVVCFRYKPKELNEEKLNMINEKLNHILNDSGKIYLSHTSLDGKYTLRMVTGQTNVKLEHVQNAWELIRNTARKLTS